MEREETRFTMRIDTGLFAVLKVLAKMNKRSTVKEIEHILEQYVLNKLQEEQTSGNITRFDVFSTDELIRNWHIAKGLPLPTSTPDLNK